MKQKFLISVKLILLLSFSMAAVSVFAQEAVPVKKTKAYSRNAIERYFTDETRTEPLLALKTNLLFDVIATPNLELEVPMGKKFSFMAEYWFPWWLDKYTGDCYKLLYGGIEGRYWFRRADDMDVLRGHFMGVYAGCGFYDLGNIDGGYMGDLDYYAGLTYGYSFKLNRFLRLETSLGIGALQTKYHRYKVTEDINKLLWQYSGKYVYFGPSKLKVSIVVLFHGKGNNKK